MPLKVEAVLGALPQQTAIGTCDTSTFINLIGI